MRTGAEAASSGIGFARLLTALGLCLFVVPAAAQPIAGKIEVMDGDTVRVGSTVYRLVNFDTPEIGSRARCEAERTKGAEASRRLRELVAGGSVDLTRLPCACRPGTEGTQKCNRGRLCGVLRAGGKDVGETMIAEGLARRYMCGPTKCPPRRSWCEGK